MKDFKRTDEQDLEIINGDFVIDESDQQHIEDIFIAQKGEFKEFPQLGFGAINYLKTTISPYKFERDLRIQLEYDNYSNPTIDTTNGIENTQITI
ncbi:MULTISPECIES: hypothetical protein [Empedobacter]|uniref:hypothetical protein n=1 Tax=Empedobacter TaxID=59734 RepID=UPI0024A64BF8|nr:MULTISPECIES: hypothetical protein [Empedobacter]